jgi:formiminotetrahydrofolate cyclodeaminase
MRNIDPLRLHINESIMNVRADIKKVKEETYLKANSAENQLTHFGKELADFRSKVSKEVEDIAVL